MSIPSLKPFTTMELIHTLMECIQNLECAYQDTLKREYWHTALQAMSACDFLKYEINAHIHDYTVH